MYNYIRMIIILGLFTSCMQVAMKKKKLIFDGEDKTPTSRPGKVNAPHVTEFLDSRSISVRFGDYKFMSASLKQKYGPSCNSTITSNILNRAALFGAVCDFYDPDNSCSDVKSKSSALALGSTMRAGRVIKTCEEVSKNSNCINYYLQQAGLSPTSSFTPMNILKAFKVYYPLSTALTPKQEDSLVKLGSKFTNASDKWKAVSLALCVSPQWQIP